MAESQRGRRAGFHHSAFSSKGRCTDSDIDLSDLVDFDWKKPLKFTRSDIPFTVLDFVLYTELA